MVALASRLTRTMRVGERRPVRESGLECDPDATRQIMRLIAVPEKVAIVIEIGRSALIPKDGDASTHRWQIVDEGDRARKSSPRRLHSGITPTIARRCTVISE